MNIYISDEDNRLNDEIKGLMQLAGETALAQEFGDDLQEAGYDVAKLPIDLSVSIVNYDEIKELNNEFRGIDSITDVLSFPQFADEEDLLYDLEDLGDSLANGDEEVLGTMLGDVVICYDRACEQAEEYGTGLKRELIYLFVHSIFHLFGYDHMEEDEKAVMRQREEAVMEVVGL
ncbi:MAG: rRNA maturation RNase YbeY [Clostridiales bacterium]|nr:rRNA maturation RNase YbeY [Candidatus Crickella equi]